MYCLKCGYNLFGLPRHVCPECGNAFNPDDDSTYQVSIKRRKYIPFWMPCVLAFYPLLPSVLVYATWLVAGYHLGREPKAMADDPNQLGGMVPIFYWAAVLSQIGLIIWAPLALVSYATYGLRGREDNRWIRVLMLLLVAAVTIGVLLSLIWSRIGYWFLD